MPKPVENRAAIVDRYGELKAKVLAFKPVQDEYEKLGSRIRGWYDAEPGDQSFTEAGTSFAVVISARSIERLPDKPRLYAALGKKRFIDMCGFTLTRIAQCFSGEELPAYVTESQTGSRRIDVQPISGVKEAA